MKSSITHFSQKDFDRCQPSCSIEDMNEDFLRMLDRARELSGVPFVLNSAYRSPDYEREKGRAGTSSHCKGLAVDIRSADSRSRFKILVGLLGAGFHRIGIGNRFIHVDCDPLKARNVVFTYYK